ncbi:MAG: protease modulator HflK [Isosphaeraceae bacterium]
MRRALWPLAGLVLLGYLATGIVVVPPGEAAVVRRAGRLLQPSWGPGLHLGWPWGVDRVTTVRIDEVRRLTVGRATTPGPGEEPGAGEFLTGDANLLRAEATLQYRVSDPSAFALRSVEVEPILRRLAEASLSRALARQSIDASLRDGRAAAARSAESALALGVERYGLGVTILGLSLTDSRPPSEVASDFAAAQAARSDRDRRVNEANSYAEATETRARAEALARVERASALADRTVALAKSRASRFEAIRAEAVEARALTVRRIFLDTLRELLPKVRRKLILTPEEPIDLSVLGNP